MKAFIITEPGKSTIGEVDPPRIGPGDVLLKTRIIGFCGTDLNTFRGKNPLVSYPRIPGHEIAATIEEKGSSVPEHIRIGSDVTVYPYNNCGVCASCRNGRVNACLANKTLGVQRDGAMQDYFSIPWQKVYAADGLSLREMSLVEPLAVGFHSTVRTRVKAGDQVAVIGCGMVGLGAIAAASRRGATVTAIDLDDVKLALAARAGATHRINSRSESVHEQLRALTDGHGPDVVIEAVGTPETFRMAVEEVAYTGRVAYIGWAKEPIIYETKLFILKELDILGSRNSLTEFPDVIDMLKQKQFPVEETISRTVAMSEAGDALTDWNASPLSFSKILVELA